MIWDIVMTLKFIFIGDTILLAVAGGVLMEESKNNAALSVEKFLIKSVSQFRLN